MLLCVSGATFAATGPMYNLTTGQIRTAISTTTGAPTPTSTPTQALRARGARRATRERIPGERQAIARRAIGTAIRGRFPATRHQNMEPSGVPFGADDWYICLPTSWIALNGL